MTLRGRILGRFVALTVAAVLCACSARQPAPARFDATLRNPPRSVAVLPFRNLTAVPGIEEAVRESVYGHLSVKSYRDLELREVDRQLRRLQDESGWEPEEPAVEELGQIFGCDAVLFGEVTEVQKIFAGFYSQQAVGACIELWDTRSGELLWTGSHVARFHSAGFPLDPLAIPITAITTGLNLREGVMTRAVDELGRELAMLLPAPEWSAGGLTAALPRAEESSLDAAVPDGQKGSTVPGPEPVVQVHHESGARPESGSAEPAATALGYEMQVGAFHGSKGAQRLLARLRSQGYPAFIREGRDRRGLWHRVIVGPFSNAVEMNRVRGEVARQLKVQPIVSMAPRE